MEFVEMTQKILELTLGQNFDELRQGKVTMIQEIKPAAKLIDTRYRNYQKLEISSSRNHVINTFINFEQRK
jgi:hypothetical protein